MDRLFLLYPTHTTRHLAAALSGAAHQNSSADGVVLTIDNDKPEITTLARDLWRSIAAGRDVPPLVLTSRPSVGEPRLNQVRNNGLRALDRTFDLRDNDRVAIIDGDTVLASDGVGKHRAATRDVVSAFRVELDEGETDALASHDWALGLPKSLPSALTAVRRAVLGRRQSRYERQALFKRFPGLVKAHKPKLLGGHHAASVGALRAVNGYDERFRGLGLDDDDLARRLHASGARFEIAVDRIDAYHLWHETRGPWKPSASPDADRFARGRGRVRAEAGWENPLEQPDVVDELVETTARVGNAP